MTLIGERPVASGADERVRTPTIRGLLRSKAYWILIGIVVVLLAAIATVLASGSTPGPDLSPASASPRGGMALAEVLREQGVEVIATSSFAETRDAVREPDETTILLIDADRILDAETVDGVLALADRIVLIDPDRESLDGIERFREPELEIDGAGRLSGAVAAGCELPVAQRAGSVLLEGGGYRASSGVELDVCFTDEDGRSALVRSVDVDGHTVTVLGSGSVLANETIPRLGNAALALGLLGERPTLVWYQPGLADLSGAGPGLGELAPGWLPYLGLLGLAVTTAAIAWRARRMGPLVIEALPVAIPASETAEGRARLYEREGARAHAADALRMGALTRIAAATGLGRGATVREIALRASELTGWALPRVIATLLDDLPGDDRELVALSDRIAALEHEVLTAVSRS